MARPTVTARRFGRRGCPLLPTCLLVLALFLGHQLLMATPRHALAMDMGRGPDLALAPAAQRVATPATFLVAHDGGGPSPLTGWEECRAQAGVVPLLLLLLTFVGLWSRLSHAALADRYARIAARVARFLHPPPLASSRRRALLQVFLI